MMLPLGEMQTFRPYSAAHAGVVVVFLLAVVALAVPGRRWDGTPRGRRWDHALAVLALAWWVFAQAFGWLPPPFVLAKSLPLQVCDIAGVVAVVALWTRAPVARAMLFFWGIGLSTQGFIQPELHEGPGRVVFWTFWGLHAGVVGAALYDVLARGYRPTWRDYGVAVVSLAIYIAVAIPLNIATGWNYGYVGQGTPSQPSVVDFLGPWPGRVVTMAVLVAAVLALLVLPFDLARRAGRRRRLRDGSAAEEPADVPAVGAERA